MQSPIHRAPSAQHWRPSLRPTLVALLLTAGPGPLSAQDAGVPETEEEIADVPLEEDSGYQTTVHGYRLRPTDECTSVARTVDVADELKSARSVSDVLAESTGVQVRRLGGLGSYGAASIRGSTPGQVPVYLDGVLLNAGGFPAVDLGDLSLDVLERIEVYRGSAPLSLDAPGIGGAIALTTRSLERPVTELAASYGSWRTARAVALHGERVGEIGALALVTAQGSRGDFEYLNRNGTTFDTSDDRIQRRQNNEHQAYGALLKLDGPLGGWRWSATNDLFAKQQGIPGIDSVPTTTTELRTLRDALTLGVEGPLGPGAALRVDGSYLALREEFRDTQNEIGVGYQHVRSAADAVGGGAQLERALAAEHASAIRLGARYERYATEELLFDRSPAPASRLRTLLGLQHEWSPTAELLIVPALRLELHHTSSDGGPLPGGLGTLPSTSTTDFFWSPALGARWAATDRLTLRANVGRYLRAPDLGELYGDRGAVIGNPALEPEVGINADLGATFIYTGAGPLALLRFDAGWFGAWVSDLIAYVQNSQSTVRPENVDGALITGAETGLELGLLELFKLRANYTYLYGVSRSDIPYYDGKRLPGRPAHEAYGRFEIGQRDDRWGVALWVDADYAGQSYLDRTNLQEDALARLLFGLGYRLERPREGLSLTLEVRNLLDTITLTDDQGRRRPLRDYEAFPLPGRTVLVTLHWRR